MATLNKSVINNKRHSDDDNATIVKQIKKGDLNVIIDLDQENANQTAYVNDETLNAVQSIIVANTSPDLQLPLTDNDTQQTIETNRTVNDYYINGIPSQQNDVIQSQQVSQSSIANCPLEKVIFDDQNKSKYIPIERLLSCSGITQLDIKRLIDSGFCTADAVANTSKRVLQKIKGVSESVAEKLLNASMKLVPMTFTTAKELHNIRSKMIVITTGSDELNKIIGGGIETGSLIEVFGESSSGKTQFCHMLAVTCQLPIGQGGGLSKAFFIDSVGSFRPERIKDIAKRYDTVYCNALDNITYVRVFNTDQLLKATIDSSNFLTRSRYSLLVVDSATALYRSEFCGREELAPRQQHLACLLAQLKRLAEEFSVAVVITNQVVANVDRSEFSDKFIHVGGHVMSHAPTMRLQFTKCRANTRQMKIYKSPNLPELTTNFSITDKGIENCLDSG